MIDLETDRRVPRRVFFPVVVITATVTAVAALTALSMWLFAMVGRRPPGVGQSEWNAFLQDPLQTAGGVVAGLLSQIPVLTILVGVVFIIVMVIPVWAMWEQ